MSKTMTSSKPPYPKHTHDSYLDLPTPKGLSAEESSAVSVLVVIISASVAVQLMAAPFLTVAHTLIVGLMSFFAFYMTAQTFEKFTINAEQSIKLQIIKGLDRRSSNDRRTLWSPMRDSGRRSQDVNTDDSQDKQDKQSKDDSQLNG